MSLHDPAINDPQTYASPSGEPLGSRVRRIPAQYQDQHPKPPVSTHFPLVPTSTIHHMFLHMFDSFHTQFNCFRIAHEYWHRPTHDPESFVSLEDLANSKSGQLPDHLATMQASQLP